MKDDKLKLWEIALVIVAAFNGVEAIEAVLGMIGAMRAENNTGYASASIFDGAKRTSN